MKKSEIIIAKQKTQNITKPKKQNKQKTWNIHKKKNMHDYTIYDEYFTFYKYFAYFAFFGFVIFCVSLRKNVLFDAPKKCDKKQNNQKLFTC